ncbi:unnamed protein product, partial [Acanthoscelides obtectus]
LGVYTVILAGWASNSNYALLGSLRAVAQTISYERIVGPCLVQKKLGVYTVILAGWASNSNYALLGSLRAVAQTISYEVSLALILLSFLYLILRLNILDFIKYQIKI